MTTPRLSRAGQAIVFTLMFLIPMFLALGLLMRVDATITLKIRLQDATDAAAQSGGAQVARVMNQIALHNMTILKYHALMAATKTAIDAAEKTKQFVSQERQLAEEELRNWTQALTDVTQCCSSPCELTPPCCKDPQACSHIQPAQDCVTCLTTQVQQWKRIEGFWQGELDFFNERKGTFEGTLGPLARDLGQKSDNLVGQLDEELKKLYAKISRQHRLDLVKTGVPLSTQLDWLYTAGDRPMESGAFDPGGFIEKAQDKTLFAQIAFKSTEGSRPDNDRGIVNFEGPPPKLKENVADKDGGRKPQDADFGPTRYYMEYIYNVHAGLPGYFSYSQMHGPLGNPDKNNPDCGGENHKTCEKDGGDYQQTAVLWKPARKNEKPCHRDQPDYSRDHFRTEAERVLKQNNDSEFQQAQESMYVLVANPKLEHLVSGKIEADQGYFNRLFKSRTVDMPDTGPRDPSKSFLHALSKFELYNLSESKGVIFTRGQYRQYAKAMLTQDWNVVMVPIIPKELEQERQIIKGGIRH